MLSVLRHPVFQRLFAAQVLALLGTGVMTVALGLLAFDLAGDRAGAVLGTVFTIKMVAYVGLSPIMAAMAERLPRRGLLITLDLIRVAAAACLPFVDEVWQVYALVFVLQAAAAGFTPAFQAVIPDVLKDEAAYTRALSLSRLAYDLENLLSPALAAVLLLVLPFSALFGLTALGFLASAALLTITALPTRSASERPAPFYTRLTRGARIYLATPRLRGLLALNMAGAAGGAMVLVNTVVLVRSDLGLEEVQVAIAMGAFGAGSMLAALALPPVLDRSGDRTVMLAGAWVLSLALVFLAAFIAVSGLVWEILLLAWCVAGAGYGAVMTPSGRLLRRSSGADARPALFAAQFALSHACWLLAYPMAGLIMTLAGALPTLLLLSVMAALSTVIAARLWTPADEVPVPHEHPELPPDHPHLQGHGPHAHPARFDELHPHWPGRG